MDCIKIFLLAFKIAKNKINSNTIKIGAPTMTKSLKISCLGSYSSLTPVTSTLPEPSKSKKKGDSKSLKIYREPTAEKIYEQMLSIAPQEQRYSLQTNGKKIMLTASAMRQIAQIFQRLYPDQDIRQIPGGGIETKLNQEQINALEQMLFKTKSHISSDRTRLDGTFGHQAMIEDDPSRFPPSRKLATQNEKLMNNFLAKSQSYFESKKKSRPRQYFLIFLSFLGALFFAKKLSQTERFQFFVQKLKKNVEELFLKPFFSHDLSKKYFKKVFVQNLVKKAKEGIKRFFSFTLN